MVRSDRIETASNNPFSVHRIRPGVIPYLFSHEDDSTDPLRLDQLIAAWQTHGHLGQIVGAHGCGKTTLAHAIAKRAVENQQIPFDSATSVTIRSKPWGRTGSPLSWLTRLLRLASASTTFGNPVLPNDHAALSPAVRDCRSTDTILIIDGIERLTLLQQAVTFHSLKRRQIPAIFTGHRDSKRLPFVGGQCPVLFRAGSDIQVFAKIVNLMTQPSKPLDCAVVEDAFKSCQGNVREAFMKLYDAFDAREFG